MKFWILLLILLTATIHAQQNILKAWQTITKHPGNLSTLALSPSGKILAAANTRHAINLYTTKEAKLVRTLKFHTKPIKSIVFHPDGNVLASADSNGTIVLWAVQTGKPIFQLKKHTKAVNFLCFRPDGKVLASAGADAKIILWSVENGKAITVFSGHKNEVTGLVFSKDGKFLLSTSYDHTVKIWQLKQANQQIASTFVPTKGKLKDFYTRGSYRKLKGDLNGAIIDFQTAIEIDDHYANAYYQLAGTYALRSQTYPRYIHSAQFQDKDIALAIENLRKAFECGFKDWKAMSQESSLVILRKDPRYAFLIEKYAKDAFKTQQKSLVKTTDTFKSSKPISFEILEKGGMLRAKADEIWVNGKKIGENDKFFPGYRYNILVKFKNYKSVKEHVYLDGGGDKFILAFPLRKLKKYTFFTRNNKIVLDGICYPYRFFADSEEIEAHLIQHRKKGVFHYYTIMAPTEAKEFKIVTGFLYLKKSFFWVKGGITRIDKLSIPLLIKHLEKLARVHQRNYKISMLALERLLKSFYWSRKIKYSSQAEISQLADYIRNWQVKNMRDQDRVDLLIDALENLIGYQRRGHH